ncbi:MAG: tryptophan synthase subunit alpha [Ferruginibacter sp.]
MEKVFLNKLDEVFRSGKKNLLNMYCTAGFPFLESTEEVVLALQNNGADMVEIGIPYSDPIADGPVIQQSNMIALSNGMNIITLFDQLKAFKVRVHIPVILMGYFNPVLQFGVEKFCISASEAGVAGVIIPDIPMHEYENSYQSLFAKHNLKFILLITPSTPLKRIKKADRLSSGFLYAVSTSSTTGNKRADISEDYITLLSKADLVNPLMFGFGINSKQTFEKACSYASGAIIASAYIKALQKDQDIQRVTKEFIDSILN